MIRGVSRCTAFFMADPAKTDRDTILATALEQVEREGAENLAIRAVAAASAAALAKQISEEFGHLDALVAVWCTRSHRLRNAKNPPTSR